MTTEQEEVPYIDVPKRWSMLCRFILFRLNQGRDVKIITIARSAQTGTGKTTLAVRICKWVNSLLQCTSCRYKNEHGEYVGGYFPPSYDECPWCGSSEAIQKEPWDAESQAHMDIMSYASHYAHESESGNAILLDEAEIGADNRRSMSNENVTVTHYWSALRFKNVVNIITLPSALHLDRRLKELGDVLFVVQKRGLAHIRWLWLNDMKEHVEKIQTRNDLGMPEEVHFDELTRDKAYSTVSKIKKDHFNLDGVQHYDESDVESIVEDEIKELKVETAQELWGKTELTQGEIGDIMDMSQQWVSNQVN